VGEVSADVVETASKLEAGPEDGTTLMQSHGKTLTNEELLLWMCKESGFWRWDSTPGEDAVKTVEMTTKNLAYYINVIGNTSAGFERTDSQF